MQYKRNIFIFLFHWFGLFQDINCIRRNVELFPIRMYSVQAVLFGNQCTVNIKCFLSYCALYETLLKGILSLIYEIYFAPSYYCYWTARLQWNLQA